MYPDPTGGSVGSRTWFSARGDCQALAELGFVVVELEGRGSTPMRSRAFMAADHGQTGTNDIADRVAGIRQLALRYRWVDTTRVGIYGTSGDGFAAAAAILRYLDFFDMAVSESPPGLVPGPHRRCTKLSSARREGLGNGGASQRRCNRRQPPANQAVRAGPVRGAEALPFPVHRRAVVWTPICRHRDALTGRALPDVPPLPRMRARARFPEPAIVSPDPGRAPFTPSSRHVPWPCRPRPASRRGTSRRCRRPPAR
jgi:Prolyl oligopeptidase family